MTLLEESQQNHRDIGADNVISIASGKGGVGKTWFAVTLCHALASAGRNILLFDGDLGLANVDVQLGLVPRNDLSKVIAGGRSLARTIEPCPACGFDLVAGHSGGGLLASLPTRRVAEICDQLFQVSQRYDRVVMDIGAGIGRTVQELVRNAGTCIVITTEDPTALTDAYAFIKVMAQAGKADDIRIVVNMAQDQRHGKHTYEALLRACENFLRLAPPLAGIVRRDSHVADAIRHQVPLLTRHPACNAADDVLAIAEHVMRRP